MWVPWFGKSNLTTRRRDCLAEPRYISYWLIGGLGPGGVDLPLWKVLLGATSIRIPNPNHQFTISIHMYPLVDYTPNTGSENFCGDDNPTLQKSSTFQKIQEISNRTHWTDPKKTWVSIGSIATYWTVSVGIRSHSIFDGKNLPGLLSRVASFSRTYMKPSILPRRWIDPKIRKSTVQNPIKGRSTWCFCWTTVGKLVTKCKLHKLHSLKPNISTC